MKKQLLFFLLFAASFNSAIAQSVFNEDYLAGKWVTNQGNPLNIEGFLFPEYVYKNQGDAIKKGTILGRGKSFYDYFISSSNRLHIIFGELCWIFKVISLTSDRMVLSYNYEYNYKQDQYDPDHPIKNIEVEFYKEEVSAINEITDETTDSDKIYNLKGQLLENEPDSGVYIQNGKKYVKK